MLMVVIAAWAATFTHHRVNSFEREHLEAAVQFVREAQRTTGAIPDPEKFSEWGRAMESRGRYRFGGGGYTLKRCSSTPSEFCIGFWTGEVWVTYRSWQTSMEEVPLDDSPPLPITGLLIAAFVAGMAGKALLAPKNLHKPSSPEAHAR